MLPRSPIFCMVRTKILVFIIYCVSQQLARDAQCCTTWLLVYDGLQCTSINFRYHRMAGMGCRSSAVLFRSYECIKKTSLSMPLRRIGGVEVKLHSLLTFALNGVWLASRTGHISPGAKRPLPRCPLNNNRVGNSRLALA